MPELPEVETTVRLLRQKIIGRKIREIWSDWPKTIKNSSVRELNKNLKGKSFSKIARRGKNILIEIDQQKTLWIHLKMTGHLLVRPTSFFGKKIEQFSQKEQKSPFADKINQYVHFRIVLDQNEELALSDVRKFAKIVLFDEPISKELLQKHFADLGIEPLSKEFTLDYFKKIIQGPKNQNKELKIFLLDQNIISGIGNIYASEIPFEAGLSPKRKIKSLKSQEIQKLYTSILTILKLAVKERGTSVSDFRDPDGKKGNFGNFRKVYQKKKELCPRCEKGVVESFKQAQRSTFWCSKCQV